MQGQNPVIRRWFELVIAERAQLAKRTAPLEPSEKLDPRGAIDSIRRAAAAMLQWQRATRNLDLGRIPESCPVEVRVREDGVTEIELRNDAAAVLRSLLFDLWPHGGEAERTDRGIRMCLKLERADPARVPSVPPHDPIDSVIGINDKR